MTQLTLSTDNKKVVQQLGNHLTEIALIYGEFMALYKSNVSIIQTTAPVFINLAGKSMFNDMLLSLQRLCEKARICGNDTLTFDYLAAAIHEPEKTAYIAKLESIKSNLASVKDWRNNLGAHNNLPQALGTAPLITIEYAKVKAAIDEASELLNMVNTWTGEPHTRYHEVSVSNGAETLLLYLQWGKKWEEEQFGGEQQT